MIAAIRKMSPQPGRAWARRANKEVCQGQDVGDIRQLGLNRASCYGYKSVFQTQVGGGYGQDDYNVQTKQSLAFKPIQFCVSSVCGTGS